MAVKSWIAGFCITVVPCLCSAQSMESIRANVHKARMAVPPYLASVLETVEVGGTPRRLEKRELSWGDRNGVRQYRIAYSNGRFRYETDSYYGDDLNGLPPVNRSWLLENGEVTSADPVLQMGEIKKLRDIDDLPPSFNYWQQGYAVDALLEHVDYARVEGARSGRVIVHGTYRTAPVALTFDPAKNWSLTRIAYGASDEAAFEVTEWAEFRGTTFPKVIVGSMRVGDSQSLAKKTYEVTNLQDLPEKFAFTLSWKDGTRVYDRVNDRVLKVEDGKLVRDPVFDKNARVVRSSKSATFLIASSIGILAALILALRLLKRGKKK